MTNHAGPELGRTRVLIVEDHDAYARALAEMLGQLPDLELVARARDGREALALARQLEPDVVLIDVGLPDRSGFEVAAALAGIVPTAGVVFSSATDSPAHRSAALEVGALFVPKERAAVELEAAARITHRACRAAAAAKEASERAGLLERLLQTSKELFALVGEDGIVSVGRGATGTLLGRTHEQIRGRSLLDLVRPAFEPALREAIARAAGQTREVLLPLEVMRDDGSWGTLEARLRRDPSGGSELRLLVAARDVTDLERALEVSRESEQRFRQITEAIDEVFWLTDVDKNEMVYVSPAYERIWGRSVQSLYDEPRSWLDAIHEADRERVRQAALTMQASGAYDVAYRIVRPDGAIRWVHDKGFPVRGADGAVHRVAGAASDVTERRELRQKLADVEAFEAVGRLAISIAHDFNNLLGIIEFEATLAAQEASFSSETSEGIVNILEAAGRAAELNRQLLGFGVRHVRPANDRQAVLDIGDAVARLVELFRRVLNGDVDLRCHVAAEESHVRASPAAIDQILMNLIVNARDALSGGGAIRVRVEPLDARALRPPSHLRASARWAHVSVEDTGSGIARENLKRIFEPFFTTKQPGKGTGLGLSTVYRLVQEHGGWISVQSAPGLGTTFHVYLPAVEPAEPREESRESSG